MNTRSLLLLTCALLVGGCASDKATSDSSSAQQKQKDPEVGMTKEQVIALYGKTDNVQKSSEGETWIYHLNMGEAFIPFGYRPKMRIINFDKDGRVAHWSYSK